MGVLPVLKFLMLPSGKVIAIIRLNLGGKDKIHSRVLQKVKIIKVPSKKETD